MVMIKLIKILCWRSDWCFQWVYPHSTLTYGGHTDHLIPIWDITLLTHQAMHLFISIHLSDKDVTFNNDKVTFETMAPADCICKLCWRFSILLILILSWLTCWNVENNYVLLHSDWEQCLWQKIDYFNLASLPIMFRLAVSDVWESTSLRLLLRLIVLICLLKGEMTLTKQAIGIQDRGVLSFPCNQILKACSQWGPFIIRHHSLTAGSAPLRWTMTPWHFIPVGVCCTLT